jgi:hypothetical protein
MSWTVAPAKALRNSFLSLACPRETIVLVTEVPILAPITTGIALSTDRTTKQVLIKTPVYMHENVTYFH